MNTIISIVSYVVVGLCLTGILAKYGFPLAQISALIPSGKTEGITGFKNRVNVEKNSLNVGNDLILFKWATFIGWPLICIIYLVGIIFVLLILVYRTGKFFFNGFVWKN